MPRISGAQRGSGVQAVVFALDILEYIAQHQGSVGVTELARAFETTKSRMHRHLQTLMAAGYLVRDPQTERYRVSARLVALGQAVSEGFEFARAARDVTRELRDKLGHAVVLSQTEDDGIRIVSLMPSKSNVEIAVKPGSVLAFHASAQGKISLAFGDPSLSERVLAGELPMNTAYTIGDPARLKAEIDLDAKARLGGRAERGGDRIQCAGSAGLRCTGALCGCDRDRRYHPVHSGKSKRRAGAGTHRDGRANLAKSRLSRRRR